MLTLLALAALAAPPDVSASLARHVPDPARAEAVLAHLDAVVAETEDALRGVGHTDGVRAALVREVAARLDAEGPARSATEIERTVIDFEAFKLRSFVTSGVYPKRYFGYFDGRHDTAVAEARVRRAVSGAVRVIDAHQAAIGSPVRVTDDEVAVTFIAEGGALWLREHQDRMDALHPVMDVGLDDLAKGVHDLPDLMAAFDAELGTDMQGLVAWLDDPGPHLSSVPNELRWLASPNERHPYLRRLMTLEEAVVGTALMWVWEKEIAAKKLRDLGATPIEARSPDQQFIVGSLVYNSGLLHNAERWAAIETFSTGAWLAETSARNAKKRWPLAVLTPPDGLARLADETYPDQPTAWLAVYHVLQRYGAWVGLHRYSDTFDATGAFVPLRPPPPEVAP